MDYGSSANNDSLVYAQWEAIHNPAIIGKLFQSDEDGAAVVSLDIDDSYENYFGYEMILNYLLSDGREKMIESIELNNISDIQAIDPESAVGVIMTALGDVKVGDPNEAVALVKEFLQTDSQRQIQLAYSSIYNELLESQYEVFPEDFVQQRINEALSYAAAITNITSRTIQYYNEIWDASRRLNFEELDAFRKGIVNTIEGAGDLVEVTYAGKVNLLAKLSNTQFKKLYLKKFPTTSNRELSVIMSSVRSGNYDYSGVVNAMSNADQIDVLSNIDDLTLASLRNTGNFTLKLYDKVVGALDIGGSAIAFVQLSMIVKNNWEISPADILSVIPSPFSLLAYWVEDVTQKLADDFEDIFWYNTRDYDMVIDWNEHMGTSIYPNEYLYMCYTDQADKCNTFTMPTSIVFMNEEEAMAVFGVSPSIVNCDYRSLIRVQSNNDIVFRPTFQFDITW